MIRVTIELIPLGIENLGLTQHLGTIDIANVTDFSSPTLQTRGNYTAMLSRKGSPASVWKSVGVQDFPRKQRNAYDLLYRVLKEAVGERNE